MDKNNIGFRQYKLSEDFSMNVAAGHEIINNGFQTDEQYPLSQAVDGNEETYCKIIGNTSKILTFNFKNNIHCHHIKILFHSQIRQVYLFNENNEEIYSKGSSTSPGFLEVDTDVDASFSSINMKFRSMENDNLIEISNIEFYSDNTIVPPTGYYIKDFEIQSEKVKGGEDNGDD